MKSLVAVGNVVGVNDGLSLIAYDNFNDVDGTNLSDHISDSGHSWINLSGEINIVGNQAVVVTEPAHYVMDLSVQARQPKEVNLQIKDTNAIAQSAYFTMRDEGDGLNYKLQRISASEFLISMGIDEVIAGVANQRAGTVAVGDYRNFTDFFSITGLDEHEDGVISFDATSIDPSLLVKWTGAGAVTKKDIGLYSEATTNLFDSIMVRG